MEEVRHADQTADFERQEKILKLISTELTRNTTRVVESAVKNVIQNSVLPALENVTRSEVKVALNAQIAKGLAESMKQVGNDPIIDDPKYSCLYPVDPTRRD